ncbi:hypothetical protein FHG87_019270 [Trinorchestia longiramus]|nr:hypothetical protein FHG87_019270 [Trinorchestia longiramus]
MLCVDENLRNRRPALVNRKTVILLHDNARPHAAKVTQENILQLVWSVQPHPPYFPDLAPTDFHLFRSLENGLQGRKFTEDNQVKENIQGFFESKQASCYSDGIKKLIGQWEKVIENNDDVSCNVQQTTSLAMSSRRRHLQRPADDVVTTSSRRRHLQRPADDASCDVQQMTSLATSSR